MKRTRKAIYIIPIMVLIVACSVATPAALPTATPSVMLPENASRVTPVLKWIGGIDFAAWSPDSHDIAISIDENNSQKVLYIQCI